MRKTWVIVGVVLAAVIIGSIVWVTLGARQQTSSTQQTENTNNGEDSGLGVVDKSAEVAFVTVEMKNSQFTPKHLKIKRGSTVKWVNQDTVRHNVVAADENDQSALPTQNPLFGKGGEYSFTFTTVGTFNYKCTPHPFMTGSIEVI